VLLADLGTRIFYTQHGGFDTHPSQGPTHPKLWMEVSQAIADFYAELTEHDPADNVLIFLFTEFGRRVRDNGSGKDHGSGGVVFAIGDAVKGGMYGEYPSLQPQHLLERDLHFSTDCRGVYGTVVEKCWGWMPRPALSAGSSSRPMCRCCKQNCRVHAGGLPKVFMATSMVPQNISPRCVPECPL
jgi:uncharacterized protein (DUF1501 family)